MFHSVTAAIAAGKHPGPFRTRKLSLPAPMVLHSRGCGRVGHRRTQLHTGSSPAPPGAGLPPFHGRSHSTNPPAIRQQEPLRTHRTPTETRPQPRSPVPGLATRRPQLMHSRGLPGGTYAANGRPSEHTTSAAVAGPLTASKEASRPPPGGHCAADAMSMAV